MFTTAAADRAGPGDALPRPRTFSRRHVSLAMLGCAFSCALPRPGHAQTAASLGSRIVDLACDIARSGAPYRNGGTGRNGFDCSGLVWYVHQQVGVAVPRRAEDQSEVAAPVVMQTLTPGDLLFFRLRHARRIDHVGIYVGDGRLVHASIRHRAVAYARLDDTYFLPRVASAGRLWGPGTAPDMPGLPSLPDALEGDPLASLC